jgi:protocatechuate 3,4-dioxygenase beta subunit
MARPVAMSGPDGGFRLEGVVAGDVELIASAEGYGPGFFGAALGWGQPVPIPLRSGATVDGLEIVLSKPTFVTGRFVDDAGAPVEGVGVQVWLQRGFAISQQATSDKEGRFRAGPFNVREPCMAYLWFSVSGYTIDEKQTEVKPGVDADAGEIRATRQATVRGVVVDGAGQPVTANVSTGHMFTESEADGTFELRGVGPGTVTLMAAAGPADLRGEVRGLSNEATLRSRPVKVETVAGAVLEGVEIVLLPTKAIRGRVITPDGRPRPGVVVGIKAEDLFEREVSDAEGKFAFERLVDGEYAVGLARSSWIEEEEETLLPEPAPVTVSAGRDDLEFILPIKGGIVTGKVVGKRDGLPIKEFDATFLRYKLFIPSDTEWASFKDGEFRYEIDEPGTWQVDIAADGLASHRTERFSLAAGEVKDLGTIRLGPGGTVAGRVLDAQQRPVPYTRINILNEKLQTNDDEPFTDLDGRFEVKGVSPGLFTVFAVSPRHPLGMVRGVDVREGERTEVQIAFVQPAPLTIDVRDSSGQPVEGAALDFTFPAVAPLTSKLFRGKIPPGYGSHKSDATGTILQPCLPPGEVTITIEMKEFEPVTKKLDLKPGEPNRVEIRLRRASG